MRKRLIRISLSCSSLLLLLCVLSLAVSTLWIPQSISVFKGEELPSYPCFSLVEEEETEGRSEASVKLFGLIPVKAIEVRKYDRLSLVPGGFVFGVKVLAEGVTVAGFSDVPCGAERTSPAKDAGLLVGDVILSINGVPVLSSHEVTAALERAGGAATELICKRGEETLRFTLVPKLSDLDGKYKTGIWVKDATSGIGTVTFVEPQTGIFGGLGHGICDGDTGKLVSFRRGNVTGVRVNGITKGVPGTPGEIRGTLQSEKLGSIVSNTECGVFGVLQGMPEELGEPLPIALSGEVKPGSAKVRCAVEGEVKDYDVCISAIHHKDGTKCFTVKVTDARLLSATGGIVQGMSGSPIIQNGKLVGAVTHVLINDPTTGYGIFIENMLNAAQIPIARAS